MKSSLVLLILSLTLGASRRSTKDAEARKPPVNLSSTEKNHDVDTMTAPRAVETLEDLQQDEDGSSGGKLLGNATGTLRAVTANSKFSAPVYSKHEINKFVTTELHHILACIATGTHCAVTADINLIDAFFFLEDEIERALNAKDRKEGKQRKEAGKEEDKERRSTTDDGSKRRQNQDILHATSELHTTCIPAAAKFTTFTGTSIPQCNDWSNNKPKELTYANEWSHASEPKPSPDDTEKQNILKQQHIFAGYLSTKNWIIRDTFFTGVGEREELGHNQPSDDTATDTYQRSLINWIGGFAGVGGTYSHTPRTIEVAGIRNWWDKTKYPGAADTASVRSARYEQQLSVATRALAASYAGFPWTPSAGYNNWSTASHSNWDSTTEQQPSYNKPAEHICREPYITEPDDSAFCHYCRKQYRKQIPHAETALLPDAASDEYAEHQQHLQRGEEHRAAGISSNTDTDTYKSEKSGASEEESRRTETEGDQQQQQQYRHTNNNERGSKQPNTDKQPGNSIDAGQIDSNSHKGRNPAEIAGNTLLTPTARAEWEVADGRDPHRLGSPSHKPKHNGWPLDEKNEITIDKRNTRVATERTTRGRTAEGIGRPRRQERYKVSRSKNQRGGQRSRSSKDKSRIRLRGGKTKNSPQRTVESANSRERQIKRKVTANGKDKGKGGEEKENLPIQGGASRRGKPEGDRRRLSEFKALRRKDHKTCIKNRSPREGTSQRISGEGGPGQVLRAQAPEGKPEPQRDQAGEQRNQWTFAGGRSIPSEAQSKSGKYRELEVQASPRKAKREDKEIGGGRSREQAIKTESRSEGKRTRRKDKELGGEHQGTQGHHREGRRGGQRSDTKFPEGRSLGDQEEDQHRNSRRGSGVRKNQEIHRQDRRSALPDKTSATVQRSGIPKETCGSEGALQTEGCGPGGILRQVLGRSKGSELPLERADQKAGEEHRGEVDLCYGEVDGDFEEKNIEEEQSKRETSQANQATGKYSSFTTRSCRPRGNRGSGRSRRTSGGGKKGGRYTQQIYTRGPADLQGTADHHRQTQQADNQSAQRRHQCNKGGSSQPHPRSTQGFERLQRTADHLRPKNRGKEPEGFRGLQEGRAGANSSEEQITTKTEGGTQSARRGDQDTHKGAERKSGKGKSGKSSHRGDHRPTQQGPQCNRGKAGQLYPRSQKQQGSCSEGRILTKTSTIRPADRLVRHSQKGASKGPAVHSRHLRGVAGPQESRRRGAHQKRRGRAPEVQEGERGISGLQGAADHLHSKSQGGEPKGFRGHKEGSQETLQRSQGSNRRSVGKRGDIRTLTGQIQDCIGGQATWDSETQRGGNHPILQGSQGDKREVGQAYLENQPHREARGGDRKGERGAHQKHRRGKQSKERDLDSNSGLGGLQEGIHGSSQRLQACTRGNRLSIPGDLRRSTGTSSTDPSEPNTKRRTGEQHQTTPSRLSEAQRTDQSVQGKSGEIHRVGGKNQQQDLQTGVGAGEGQGQSQAAQQQNHSNPYGVQEPAEQHHQIGRKNQQSGTRVRNAEPREHCGNLQRQRANRGETPEGSETRGLAEGGENPRNRRQRRATQVRRQELLRGLQSVQAGNEKNPSTPGTGNKPARVHSQTRGEQTTQAQQTWNRNKRERLQQQQQQQWIPGERYSDTGYRDDRQPRTNFAVDQHIQTHAELSKQTREESRSTKPATTTAATTATTAAAIYQSISRGHGEEIFRARNNRSQFTKQRSRDRERAEKLTNADLSGTNNTEPLGNYWARAGSLGGVEQRSGQSNYSGGLEQLELGSPSLHATDNRGAREQQQQQQHTYQEHTQSFRPNHWATQHQLSERRTDKPDSNPEATRSNTADIRRAINPNAGWHIHTNSSFPTISAIPISEKDYFDEVVQRLFNLVEGAEHMIASKQKNGSVKPQTLHKKKSTKEKKKKAGKSEAEEEPEASPDEEASDLEEGRDDIEVDDEEHYTIVEERETATLGNPATGDKFLEAELDKLYVKEPVPPQQFHHGSSMAPTMDAEFGPSKEQSKAEKVKMEAGATQPDSQGMESTPENAKAKKSTYTAKELKELQDMMQVAEEKLKHTQEEVAAEEKKKKKEKEGKAETEENDDEDQEESPEDIDKKAEEMKEKIFKMEQKAELLKAKQEKGTGSKSIEEKLEEQMRALLLCEQYFNAAYGKARLKMYNEMIRREHGGHLEQRLTALENKNLLRQLLQTSIFYFMEPTSTAKVPAKEFFNRMQAVHTRIKSHKQKVQDENEEQKKQQKDEAVYHPKLEAITKDNNNRLAPQLHSKVTRRKTVDMHGWADIAMLHTMLKIDVEHISQCHFKTTEGLQLMLSGTESTAATQPIDENMKKDIKEFLAEIILRKSPKNLGEDMMNAKDMGTLRTKTATLTFELNKIKKVGECLMNWLATCSTGIDLESIAVGGEYDEAVKGIKLNCRHPVITVPNIMVMANADEKRMEELAETNKHAKPGVLQYDLKPVRPSRKPGFFDAREYRCQDECTDLDIRKLVKLLEDWPGSVQAFYCGDNIESHMEQHRLMRIVRIRSKVIEKEVRQEAQKESKEGGDGEEDKNNEAEGGKGKGKGKEEGKGKGKWKGQGEGKGKGEGKKRPYMLEEGGGSPNKMSRKEREELEKQRAESWQTYQNLKGKLKGDAGKGNGKGKDKGKKGDGKGKKGKGKEDKGKGKDKSGKGKQNQWGWDDLYAYNEPEYGNGAW